MNVDGCLRRAWLLDFAEASGVAQTCCDIRRVSKIVDRLLCVQREKPFEFTRVRSGRMRSNVGKYLGTAVTCYETNH